AVTIIPFGIASIRNRLRELGLIGVPRKHLDGSLFISDGGGVVLDLRMPDRDPRELAEALDHVTGVVDHGIFIDEADTVLVEYKSGEIRRFDRE
ncbi:MAG: ribose-5-phosphate isomerase A, partial [bacterium]